MTIWTDSLKELRQLRVVVFCGMMAALACVLGYVASFEIGPYIRIGFSGLPNLVVDYLFGPAVGGIFGGVLDVLKWMLKPTGPFFPGFTLSAVLGAAVYGCFYYRRPVSLWRIAAANLIVKVFVNVLLNSVWLKLLYGRALAALLPSRIVSNAVMLPIDIAITYVLLKAVDRSVKPLLRAGGARAGGDGM